MSKIYGIPAVTPINPDKFGGSGSGATVHQFKIDYALNPNGGYIADLDSNPTVFLTGLPKVNDLFITTSGYVGRVTHVIPGTTSSGEAGHTVRYAYVANLNGEAGAVSYNEQTLTEDQKAQARENIGAATVEKWELLADITTTEEVNSIYVNTDTGGNAFKCKRIIAFALLPSNGPHSEFFGVGPSEWDDPYLFNNVPADAICRTYDITALTATAFLLESGYSNQQHFWTDMEVTKIFRRASLNAPFLSAFLLTANNGATYPTGTNLKVWGVKA